LTRGSAKKGHDEVVSATHPLKTKELSPQVNGNGIARDKDERRRHVHTF